MERQHTQHTVFFAEVVNGQELRDQAGEVPMGGGLSPLADQAEERRGSLSLPKRRLGDGIDHLYFRNDREHQRRRPHPSELHQPGREAPDRLRPRQRRRYAECAALHHSFEFTTGFLLPLSRGAQITYIEELDGEVISRTLKKGHVTCIVGVPALWDALKRRVLNRFAEKSTKLEDLVTAFIDANYLLRDETPLNFGPLLFLPIHMAFGGKKSVT